MPSWGEAMPKGSPREASPCTRVDGHDNNIAQEEGPVFSKGLTGRYHRGEGRCGKYKAAVRALLASTGRVQHPRGQYLRRDDNLLETIPRHFLGNEQPLNQLAVCPKSWRPVARCHPPGPQGSRGDSGPGVEKRGKFAKNEFTPAGPRCLARQKGRCKSKTSVFQMLTICWRKEPWRQRRVPGAEVVATMLTLGDVRMLLTGRKKHRTKTARSCGS